ncbi:MAG: hypothetical protein HZC55_20535 [Verrucomicrobia bacterium]|nr:hypothetical protein [Verrucomicrobiota bacterium]
MKSAGEPRGSSGTAAACQRCWGRWTRRWVTITFGVATVGLAAWLASEAWCRGIDPQVDFGVQVYLPQRILAGEHLGRDFVHPYGPLSSYYHAGLFWVFGGSIRTLLWSNVVVLAAVLGLQYVVLRRAFGSVPAAVASGFGIAAVVFGHYTGTKNYSFLAPYAHEGTHGLLLLLALVARVGGRSGHASLRTGLGDGLLFGLVCLTKVEIAFAAVLLLTTIGLLQCARIDGRRVVARWATGVAAAWSGVLAVAWGGLAILTSGRDAGVAVGSGFLSPWLYPAYVQSTTILSYLGLDQPLVRLGRLAAGGGVAVGVLAAVFAPMVAAERVPWLGGAAGRVLLVGGVGVVLAAVLPWPLYELALGYPLLLLLAGIWMAGRTRRALENGERIGPRLWAQWVSWVTATSLLARMALAPRIYHYGFLQALVATVWLAGFLVGELPRLLSAPWCTRRLGSSLAGVLLAVMAGPLAEAAVINYRASTQPIGVGADRIYGFGPRVFVCHEDIEAARSYLVTRLKPGASLLVVPEGLLFNIWTRTTHPLRITNLLPATLRLNRGAVVDDLQRHPPDYVVLITHLVEDDGYPGFGADEASGRSILRWIEANYIEEAHTKGDPLRPFRENNFGLRILRHRSRAP